MDIFEIAVQRFGAQVLPEDPASLASVPDGETVADVPMPSRGLAFGCQGCGRHDSAGGIHWCYDRQARKFRNIAFIKACPLR